MDPPRRRPRTDDVDRYHFYQERPILRRALAIDLAAPEARQRQLAEWLRNFDMDAVDRERIKGGLGTYYRNNAYFKTTLQNLYRWRLELRPHMYHVRKYQWEQLLHLLHAFLRRYNESLGNVNPGVADGALYAAQKFLLQHKQNIARCLELDSQRDGIVPPNLAETIYELLEVDIRYPNQQQQQQEQQQQEGDEYDEDNDQGDNQNDQPQAPIAPGDIRGRINDPYHLALDLTLPKYHERIRQDQDFRMALFMLYRASMDADRDAWTLVREPHDPANIFCKEVAYRLYNSLAGREDVMGGNYFISIDTPGESKAYRINQHDVPGLFSALSSELMNAGVEVGTENVASDNQVVIVRGARSAIRVRFGDFGTIYNNTNNSITPPSNVGESIPRILCNLSVRDNPLGSVNNIARMEPGALRQYVDGLQNNNVNQRISLMRRNRQIVRMPRNVQILRETNAPRRGRGLRQGQFFPFFNLTKYDLKRYQIAKTPSMLEDRMFDDCCLIYALRMSGLISDIELTEMDSSIVTRQLRPAKMKNYFSEHDLKVTVKTLRDTYLTARTKGETIPHYKYKTQSFGEGTREIKVFLLEGHFMLDEETPIKWYSFEHQDYLNEHFQHPEKKKAPNGMEYDSNDTITKMDYRGNVHRENKRKGMNSSDLIVELYVKYLRGEKGIFKKMLFDDLSPLKSVAYKDVKKKRRYEEILLRLATEPIYKIQKEEYRTLEFTKDSVRPLEEPQDKSNKHMRKADYKAKAPLKVFYADFESCTADDNGVYLEAHIPFMCCVCESNSSSNKATFIGKNCGEALLNWILSQTSADDGTLPVVYFHNLSYDINFLLKYGVESTVNRNSLILQSDFMYKGRCIRLKDSYGLLSMSLRNMARSFKIEIEKEIFPYTYYSPHRVELNAGDVDEVFELEDGWNEEDKAQFIFNLHKLGENDHSSFNMIKYAQFYCERDVDVLRRCVDMFHQQVMDSFQIDCHRVISISSIADKYLRKMAYYPFGEMFVYANHIRDFLLDAVHGGRVMCARNERHHFIATDREHGLWDLDAVSLYPSAMSCLYTVGGTPEPLQLEELRWEYLHNNPDITAYVVEIYITKINKKRNFPLVIRKDPKTGKITNTNKPPVRMTVCDIELEDLVEFQEIEFSIIRGLKWRGTKDYRLRTVVTDLFNKRAQYKRDKNPLENCYKLLLNSIYGKTIQKAIDHEYKYYKPNEGFYTWVSNHSNYIENIKQIKDSEIIRIKQLLPINRHFNNTLLGVQILAMSKRLMNRVMCLCDDLHIDVYYQDTDSMHIRRDCVPLLERAYATKYARTLRGSNLCQFHPDFDPICAESVPEEVTATESYFLGKKCYLDRLVDQRGNVGWHVRMKGVSLRSIQHAAKGDLLGLYKRMFDGETIAFDLCCDGQVKFDNAKDGTVKTKNDFVRAVKATAKREVVPFVERWAIIDSPCK